MEFCQFCHTVTTNSMITLKLKLPILHCVTYEAVVSDFLQSSYELVVKIFGLDTWLVFVEYLVNRDMLMKILSSYEIPDSLISIIKCLYQSAAIKFTWGKNKHDFPSLVGVKQGNDLAPILFFFIMQTVMETLEAVWSEHNITPLASVGIQTAMTAPSMAPSLVSSPAELVISYNSSARYMQMMAYSCSPAGTT